MPSTLSGVCAATSTPAENALPSPLKTTVETSARSSISASVCANSSIIGTSITFRGARCKAIRESGGWMSTASRARLDSTEGLMLGSLGRCASVVKHGSQVDRRLPDLADRSQRIARPGLLGNPFLFVSDDFEQQLLVLGRRHVVLQVFFVGAVVDWFSCLRVEFLPSPTPNRAIELDVGCVEFGLARLQRTVETFDQAGHFIAVEIAVVVVKVVKVRSFLVFGFVVAALHAPDIGPVRGRGMIGAEQVI